MLNPNNYVYYNPIKLEKGLYIEGCSEKYITHIEFSINTRMEDIHMDMNYLQSRYNNKLIENLQKDRRFIIDLFLQVQNTPDYSNLYTIYLLDNYGITYIMRNIKFKSHSGCEHTNFINFIKINDKYEGLILRMDFNLYKTKLHNIPLTKAQIEFIVDNNLIKLAINELETNDIVSQFIHKIKIYKDNKIKIE